MFPDLQNLQPDPITYNFGGYPNVRNAPQPLRDQRTYGDYGGYGGYGGYGEMQGPTSSSRQQSSFLGLMPSNRIDLGAQERFPQRMRGRRQQEPFVTDLEYSSVNAPEPPRPDRSEIYDPGRLTLGTPPQRLDASSRFSNQRRRRDLSRQQLVAKSPSPSQSSSADYTSESSRRPVRKIRKRYTKISSNTADQLEYDRLMHSLVRQPRVITDSPQLETASTESQPTRPSSSGRGSQPLLRPRQRLPNPDYRYKTPSGKKELREIQQALQISRADYENCTGGIPAPNTSVKECYAFQLSELDTSAYIVCEQKGQPMTSSLISRGPWHFQIGNWMYSDVLDGITGEQHSDQSRATAQRRLTAQRRVIAQRRARDLPRGRNPISALGSQLGAASSKTRATDPKKSEGDLSQVKEGQHQGAGGQHEASSVQTPVGSNEVQAEGDESQAKGAQTRAKDDETQAEGAQSRAEGLQATDGATEQPPTMTDEDMHESNAVALMALAKDAKRKLTKGNEEAASEHATPTRAQEESYDSPLSELNSDDLQFLD